MLFSGDTMIQVKVFDEEHEEDLEQEINDFLTRSKHIQLQDIKFSTAIGEHEEEQIYCFSALIIYQVLAHKEEE